MNTQFTGHRPRRETVSSTVHGPLRSRNWTALPNKSKRWMLTLLPFLLRRARSGRVRGWPVTSDVIACPSLPLPTTTSYMAAAPTAAATAPAQLPPKRQALKDAGDALFREKNYEGALKKYEAAIRLAERAELQPGVENAVLYSNQAACELALKQ
jgi:hypothetical protein